MIEDYPKISVVTPSFNQVKYIGKTIKSVLDQNYPNLEYIIIDAGSIDGTVEIINKYKDDLKYFVSEPDNGHGDALNKGFRQSTGEIMAWINSDDYYLPWTFQTVAEIFHTFPEVQWIVGLNSYTKHHGIWRSTKIHKNIYDYLLGDFQWIQQESVFWRRSLWDKAGGQINEDMRLMVDGELWCRFFRHARLHHVRTILASYRSHEENRAKSYYNECIVEMKQSISKLYDDIGKSTKQNLRQIKRVNMLDIHFKKRITKKSIFKEYSVGNFLLRKLHPKASTDAAYDIITPSLDGRWEKSKLPFFNK